MFVQEDLSNMPDLRETVYSGGVTLTEVFITPAAVEAKLRHLDATKAQGPDKIPPKVLKELSKELSSPLSLLFNMSIDSGEIPEDWKSAEITPIFKKGSRNEPGNYRPVSLTCIVCKVMESI